MYDKYPVSFVHKHLIKVVLFTSWCIFFFPQVLPPPCKGSHLSSLYCCCFFSYFTSHECNHCTTKIHHNNSSLFFFTQIPWDVASETRMISFIGCGSVRTIADKKALGKILLCLDRWCAPVLITTIKHSSRLQHSSLEAEYAWRLTQIPYCEMITQQKVLCFGALAGFKVDYLFSSVFSC